MTQVFQDDGTMVAVSVVAIEPNTVTRLRTTERDGYTAVQLGTERRQEADQARGRPAQGPAQGRDHPRVPGRRASTTYEVGQTVALGDLFDGGRPGRRDRRLQGQGLRRPHQAPPLPPRPQDPRLRPPPRARLDRSGHDARVASTRASRWPATWATSGSTIKKVRVVRTDPERNLLLVKGSLPGARGALILVKKA